MTESTALTTMPASGVDTYRLSTDAASISKAIVLKTAMEIQGRKYVMVEGWQAIAIAHGCSASSGNVQRVEGGFKATGQVRRMDTGIVIAEAEGFVGEDEAVWFGGTVINKWGKEKTHPKRPDYAIRAMAQTRAISRACRSAFAHVVVMMDAGLQTTPAEEVPEGGFEPIPGPAGAAARALDETAHDIAQQNGGETRSMHAINVAEKAKGWADAAISSINLSGNAMGAITWARAADTVPEGKKKSPLQWLEDNAPDQFVRVNTAYTNVTGESLRQ